MSLSPEQERRKLKAKRYNKFEPSSSPKIERRNEGNSITKRGFKRTVTEDDDNYSVKPKRICTANNVIALPSPTKNLANNRLKKLKEEIQLSANTVKTNKPENVEVKAFHKKNNALENSFYSLDSEHGRGTFGKISKKNISDPNISYKNTEYSCLNQSKKNLADDRLRNIKRKLNTSDYNTKTPSVSLHNEITNSSIDIPQCSSWKSDSKRDCSIKHVSNITNICDYSLPDTTNVQCKNVSLRKSRSPPRINVNKQNITFCCSTPVSERLSVKSKNVTLENKYLSQKHDNSKSALQTFANADNRSCVFDSNCDNKKMFDDVTQKLDESIKPENFSFIPECGNDTEMENSHRLVGNDLCKITEQSRDISKFDDETTDMEWTNIEPNEDIDQNKNLDGMNEKSRLEENIIKYPDKIKDVCVVVDTNVFISALSKIQDIVNFKTTGICKPIVFVPWMVITELDYMKDTGSRSKLQNNIINAIRFINSALNEKNPRVVGQTVFDVDKQKHIGSSPDDKILSCCLQAAQKYETVILLSNDLNLKNKAMINDVTACSSNEIMMKLMSKLMKNTKSQKIMSKMGILCSSIICDCMKDTYGDVWLKMDMMSYPPWSLMECLKRFKKYWSTVFKEKFMKQFTKTVQDLQYLLDTNKYISDDSEEFVEFMKLCVTLCIFLKDIEECRGFVENTLDTITKTA